MPRPWCRPEAPACCTASRPTEPHRRPDGLAGDDAKDRAVGFAAMRPTAGRRSRCSGAVAEAASSPASLVRVFTRISEAPIAVARTRWLCELTSTVTSTLSAAAPSLTTASKASCLMASRSSGRGLAMTRSMTSRTSASATPIEEMTSASWEMVWESPMRWAVKGIRAPAPPPSPTSTAWCGSRPYSAISCSTTGMALSVARSRIRRAASSTVHPSIAASGAIARRADWGLP